MNAFEFQNAIRIMFCMGKKEFQDCFGPDNGSYFWAKYTEDFNRSPADLICYFGPNNIQTLFNYIQDQNILQNVTTPMMAMQDLLNANK
jgi:uncharacterized protein YcgL (UPF0745 family)